MDIKSYVITLHLLGLVVGLGSVTTLDLYLIRFLRGRTVTQADADLVAFVSRLATIGLACLWVSGLGFLAIYWLKSPNLLENPKVQAKIVIVCVLTLNGILLHYKVLPEIKRAVGHAIFGPGTTARRDWMRVCAIVSAASWWTPFALGAIRELNFAAPMWVFLFAYLCALGVCAAVFSILEVVLSRRLFARGRAGAVRSQILDSRGGSFAPPLRARSRGRSRQSL